MNEKIIVEKIKNNFKLFFKVSFLSKDNLKILINKNNNELIDFEINLNYLLNYKKAYNNNIQDEDKVFYSLLKDIEFIITSCSFENDEEYLEIFENKEKNKENIKKMYDAYKQIGVEIIEKLKHEYSESELEELFCILKKI